MGLMKPDLQNVLCANTQGPVGGVSNTGGGVFQIWTSRSRFVLFCPSWDFPDFSGTWIFPLPRIFPDLSFSSYHQPIKSTYKEPSRKGLRHNPDLSRKGGEPTGLPSLPKQLRSMRSLDTCKPCYVEFLLARLNLVRFRVSIKREIVRITEEGG